MAHIAVRESTQAAQTTSAIRTPTMSVALERTVMISGPMSGLPDYNRPAFNSAARAIEGRGRFSLNPARQPGGLEWSEYMRRSLIDVCQAETVVLLPGWESSPGATIEVQVARSLGIPVVDYREWIDKN